MEEKIMVEVSFFNDYDNKEVTLSFEDVDTIDTLIEALKKARTTLEKAIEEQQKEKEQEQDEEEYFSFGLDDSKEKDCDFCILEKKYKRLFDLYNSSDEEVKQFVKPLMIIANKLYKEYKKS